ncbi:MAG: hypothetical protein HQK65_12900 [Desulfamplus sp.]|nr:hypothetical protein [Desulfamplus sp.]
MQIAEKIIPQNVAKNSEFGNIPEVILPKNEGQVRPLFGAVLVQCVRDVYGDPQKAGHPERKGNLEKGRGIGDATILSKEPSLKKHSVISALSVFRSTGQYLKLLKKGGLPEEFWTRWGLCWCSV